MGPGTSPAAGLAAGLSGEDERLLRAHWRDLVDRRLPEAARARPDWPVRLDHCFARILLDEACGGPWRESVAPPAWANMPVARLADALALGEAVLAGEADLAALNQRSLARRGKVRPPAAPTSLSGPRVRLRRWRRADDAPFAALNADPAVMRYFPATKDRDASLAEARALARRFDGDGFGPWAVELAEEGPDGSPGFVGFAGPWRVPRPMPFAPHPGRVVEIGWRFARAAWGRGLAAEAARLSLGDAFGRCGLAEVVAYTAALNAPSRRLMERLGMRRDPGSDFDHPALPSGHPLAPHVLYRLAAAEFGMEPTADPAGETA